MIRCSGFDCNGQDYCGKTFNSAPTITYTDATLSVETTVRAITATGIQVRFKASESSIVPIVADSLNLPHGPLLSKRDKAGIGIGVGAGVIILGYFVLAWVKRYRRSKQVNVNRTDPLETAPSLGQDESPPAYSRTKV